jgi:murein DD-endopeptidase MepM/ murein hydrolase activator NlpD
LRTIRSLLTALTLSIPAATLAEAPPAPPTVAIPFGCGLTFPVSQTHNTGSHVENDSWAWDFRMPVGTPVVAATDGVVRMSRGDSTQGACDPAYAAYANYVVIDTPAGIETQYLHFSKVLVKAGDRVHAGDLIGYSGETGWACGAHLHFKVATHRTEGWNNPSIPALLVGYGDPKVETLIAAPSCKGPEVIEASRQGEETPTDPALVQAVQAKAEGGGGEKAEVKPAMGLKAAIVSPAVLKTVANHPG